VDESTLCEKVNFLKDHCKDCSENGKKVGEDLMLNHLFDKFIEISREKNNRDACDDYHKTETVCN